MFAERLKNLVANATLEFDNWSTQPCESTINTQPPESYNEEQNGSNSYSACLSEQKSIVDMFELKVFDEVAFQKLLGLKHLVRRIKPPNASSQWDMLINGIEFIDDILKYIYFCVFEVQAYRGAKCLETSMEKKLLRTRGYEN